MEWTLNDLADEFEEQLYEAVAGQEPDLAARLDFDELLQYALGAGIAIVVPSEHGDAYQIVEV